MRNCECICTPPMFRSRVSGVGMDLSSQTQYTPAEIATQKARTKYAADMALWEQTHGEAYSKVIDGCPRCITFPCPCPAANEFLRLNPEPVMQEVSVAKTAAAKPATSALPLLLGAAYLLFA